MWKYSNRVLTGYRCAMLDLFVTLIAFCYVMILAIMRLFHITDRTYQLGEVISIDNFEGDMCFYHKSQREYQWINETLDYYRPTNYPLRKKCIYAFDKLGHCFSFVPREPSTTKHCYEIEMDAVGGFPMVLAGRMDYFKENTNTQRAIAEEYWRPTEKWKVCEYLGNEMTIISEVKLDVRQCNVSRFEYLEDYDKAKALF